MKTYVLMFSLIIGLAWGYILVTDTRVLLKETKVKPGENTIVEGYGELNIDQKTSLVCEYFNGQTILERIYWYSPNNMMGKDSCPFITHK